MTDTDDTLPPEVRSIYCDECGHESRAHRMRFDEGFPVRSECVRDDCSCHRFVHPPRKGERPILTRDGPVADSAGIRARVREQMDRFDHFLTDLRSDASRRDGDH